MDDVDEVAQVSGHRSEGDADDHRHYHRTDPDEQGKTTTVQDQAENVMAIQVVETEEMPQRWALPSVQERVLIWCLDVVREKHVPDRRSVAGDDDDDKRQRRPLRQRMVHEAAIGELTEAELLDADRIGVERSGRGDGAK